MLLNLASVAGATGKDGLWGFIQRYAPEATPETHPDLDQAAGFALRYFHDFVAPELKFRLPNAQERAAIEALLAALASPEAALAAIAAKNAALGNDEPLPEADFHSDEFLQSVVFAIGKTQGFENLRDWFQALYEVLLGQSQGPRFGGFIALYGVAETRALIERALAGEFAQG
jgi:lysyl-tRNA synthetase class 1